MRIRSNIFLWVFVATVVPMTLMVLAVTYYSEQQHREQVDSQMIGGLDYLVTEIERRLTFERDVIEALSVSPSMLAFGEILAEADGEEIQGFEQNRDNLAAFLEEFQAVFLDVGTIRVLDEDANSVIKVRFGSQINDAVTGIKPYPYAEPEAVDDFFFEEMRTLAPGQVSYVLLPGSHSEFAFGGLPPMLDAVVPLQDRMQDITGFLLVNSIGAQVDRILEMSPRLYEGKLMIVELNPDQSERNGLLLYDQRKGHVFSVAKPPDQRLSESLNEQLTEAVFSQPSGVFETKDSEFRVYYAEYLPYPNQLISWVVATIVPMEEIVAPYARLRISIALIGGVSLFASIVLAQLGSLRLATPIIQLAENLKSFARGQPISRSPASVTEEIKVLQNAFNYMAHKTRKAEEKRDEAESQLLQSAKLASIGEMAAGIGHEINNPLNNIMALVKLIRRDLPDKRSPMLDDLNSLQEETERASRIVHGILNFARQETPHYTNIGVPNLVDGSVALVHQVAMDEGVEIHAETDSDLYVEGDFTQLQQVMVNLLLNAIQASPRNGAIEVKAHSLNEAMLEVSVSDQGEGVSEQLKDKLFDPFFTTKPVGKGSGLGLSISLGIIQRHGGTISVHNIEPHGLCVLIHLPKTAPNT